MNPPPPGQLEFCGCGLAHDFVLLVVRMLTDVSCKSVVSNLHYFVVSHQNVARSQIAVNDLERKYNFKAEVTLDAAYQRQ